jgi:septum formation protein
MKSLILGSNSPRRKEILTQLGFSFHIRASDIDETAPANMAVIEVAEHLAIMKNRVIAKAEDEVVLTADTVVIIDDQILGKPKDGQEAIQMLKQLSGKSHIVLTGVCIASLDRVSSFSSKTAVLFNILTDAQIKHYVTTFQPFDKAGSYGIQEWIGSVAIKELHGSYLNVVGLPADRVYAELVNNFGIHPLL